MRRPALLLALFTAILLVFSGPAEAKKKKRPAKAPVVTSVSPLRAVVGQQLTIRGKNFRAGKGKNGVGFKADGQPIVFVKSGLSTRRMMKVTLPSKLDKVLGGGTKRFRLRVLTSRFGKKYTPVRLSPMIAPKPGSPVTTAPVSTPPATLPPDATGTGAPIKNCDVNATGGGDQDADRLSDGLERAIGTDPCSADSDGDGVEDGYEYRSAIDLNDDEYQHPNTVLPYPGKRPYPNPLDGSDAAYDFDGDVLSLGEEYKLWLASTPAAVRSFADAAPKATPLSYSDGLQYSVSQRCPVPGNSRCGAGDDGRRVPTIQAGADPDLQAFYAWAQSAGYAKPRLVKAGAWYDHEGNRATYDITDVRLSSPSGFDADFSDADGNGLISDDERDADQDGLSNYTEFHGPMLPSYWASCYPKEPVYPLPYVATDPTDADTDGDGVRDGADDEDRDGYPNIMELSRIAASGHDDRGKADCIVLKSLDTLDADGNYPPNHPGDYGYVNPFNPCLPNVYSETCRRFWQGTPPAPFTGPTWWALQ